MEHRKFVATITALLIPFVTVIPQPRFFLTTLAAEKIRVLKISTGDKRAVIKTSSEL